MMIVLFLLFILTADHLIFTGVEFYIGLPKELNYRVARYFADTLNFKGLANFVRMLMDKDNREIMWGMISGNSKIKMVLQSIPELQDVSLLI